MSDPKSDVKPDQSKPLTVQDLATLLPTMMAAIATASNQPKQASAPYREPIKAKCSECGQVKTGCEGKHVKMTVLPASFQEYFPGVILNGIKYLSNDDGHTVTVPANAESTILGIIAGYERNEQELASGRKAVRHSGVVSPGGARTMEQHSAWR